MDILVDDREAFSRIELAVRKYAGKNYTKQSNVYSNHRNRVEVKRLDVGDFVFNGEVVFEYKKLPDFVHSVRNGRIFKQAFKLSQYYNFHFIVLVSSRRQRDRYFHNLKHRGVTGIYFDDNFFVKNLCRLNTVTNVLMAEDDVEALDLMYEQARACIDMSVKIKNDNSAFNWLRGIRGVSILVADRIVRRYGLSTLDDLFGLTYDLLVDIDGVGDEIADLIMKSI